MIKEQEKSPVLLFCTETQKEVITKMDFKVEILKTIQLMIDKKIGEYKADRTYKSVIKRITNKGYVVLDDTGSERTVQCCIPGVELKVGQGVYVKEPMGDLRNLHIVGVVGK